MTKLRTRIVSRAALKMRAQELDLGRYLMMGRGEEAAAGANGLHAGGRLRKRVGAVYLDGGFDAARNFVLRATEDDFERIARDPEEGSIPKGALARSSKPLNRAHRSTKFWSRAARITRSASSRA